MENSIMFDYKNRKFQNRNDKRKGDLFHISRYNRDWDWEIIVQDPIDNSLDIDENAKPKKICLNCKQSPVFLTINEWEENLLYSASNSIKLKVSHYCYECAWNLLDILFNAEYTFHAYFQTGLTPAMGVKRMNEIEKAKMINDIRWQMNEDREKLRSWSQKFYLD